MFTRRWNRFSAYTMIFFGVSLFLVYFFIPTNANGDTVSENTGDAGQQKHEEYSAKVKELVEFLEGRYDSFVYNRVGRPDPFMPFLKEKVVTSDLEAPSQELVGMQKFELGQLSLVAVVLTQNGHLAMVEDSIGRGYIIRTGTEIGRTGVVDSIYNNVVIIKQRYKTTSGEEHHKFVEMFLKKEGEKQ